jgi:hypothetical protein
MLRSIVCNIEPENKQNHNYCNNRTNHDNAPRLDREYDLSISWVGLLSSSVELVCVVNPSTNNKNQDNTDESNHDTTPFQLALGVSIC